MPEPRSRTPGAHGIESNARLSNSVEPAWGRDFAFAVDVSATYPQKRAAINEYSSIFRVDQGDRLLTLYEAEDAYLGRLFDVAYAEAFKSQSPLLVDSPSVFLPALHA